MDLDELRTVQATERRKDSLQHLRDSFYADVATYIADLRAQRDRRAERVDDPFSDDGVRRLSDEIETAEEVAEAIYERRVGKVVKLASFAAADMTVEEDGMTEDERRLFCDLVDRIEHNKATVLDALSGVTRPDELGDSPESPAERPKAAARQSESEPAFVPDSEPPSTPDTNSEPEAIGGDEERQPVAPRDAGAGGGDLLADAMGGGREAATDDSGGSEDGADGVDDPSALRTDGAAGVAGATGDEATNGQVPSDPDATDAGSQPGDGAADESNRTTVRITADVGSILGIDDREYDLEREDVVTLPSTNAGPLLDRGAAERLE